MLLPKTDEYRHQAGRHGVEFFLCGGALARIGRKFPADMADEGRDIDEQVVEAVQQHPERKGGENTRNPVIGNQ